MLFKVNKKRSKNRGISPAISSVIMTGAMVAILSVTLVFANNFLWDRVAEGDFNSSKQLMRTIGLQIDDVAWTEGRTETTNYATQYGNVVMRPATVNYTINVGTSGLDYTFSNETGIIMFNLPTSSYTIADGYWENIFPSQNDSLTLSGTSAPVARVFAVEQVPMSDGSYIRVVVVPVIRVLYSNITTGPSDTTHYIRMYLPVLSPGESPRLTDTITLSGQSVKAYTIPDVQSLTVTASFDDGSDFNSDFFNFPFDFEDLSPSGGDDVVLEFYLSEVSVSFGIN
ncbi:MAG: hypothetical protein CW716_07495 [Candidatus Bathyarchaeum sp.]|nr:MAG: hypothetical protein CW716_07495 [Candidatus Bathyarchaeum sp.]